MPKSGFLDFLGNRLLGLIYYKCNQYTCFFMLLLKVVVLVRALALLWYRLGLLRLPGR